MVDSDLGLTIVFNGCIYNYPELRAELAKLGYTFFSHGDTEVICKAWHAWGPDCVKRFHGMFAFAIAERDSGRVILARDRFGIKPLYYSQSNGTLRFASSLPAVVAAGNVDTTIDKVALHHYMSFHAVVPPPHTILQGVRKLPPATLRIIEANGNSATSPTGRSTTPAARPTSRFPTRSGATACWRRCAPRSSAAWWPTCRSACCCRAASIPASSSGCSPRRASTG
jgi:asparagine synthetase B (glutamine-hydrolysing)